MTMSIPVASRQSAFTVYKAIVVPSSQMDENTALEWKIESEYLAVSEDLRETSLVTRDKMDKWSFVTWTTDASCLATLYFGNLMNALAACDTKPLKVKATNMGYGNWLKTCK